MSPTRAEPSEPRDARSVRAAETAFVAFTWLGSLAAVILLVARYAPAVPFYDDASLADLMDPYFPRGREFYWMPHNEHLVPVTRFVYGVLLDTTGSFRAGMWLQIVLLALVSAGLLWALRRRTGGTRVTDALVPLSLLSLGASENFLSSFQIAFTLPVVLALALLACGLSYDRMPRWRAVLGVWVVLFVMMGCSAIGWLAAIVLALVPAGIGIAALRARADGWRATAATACIGAFAFGAAAIAFYRATPVDPAQHGDVERMVAVVLQLLAGVTGGSAPTYWPWSGVFAAVVFVAAIGVLAVALARSPARASFVLAVLLSGLAIAAGVAWGRGGQSDMAGFASRYQVLGALSVCAAYAGLRLFGRGVIATFVELLAFGACLASWSICYYDGVFRDGIRRFTIESRFEASVVQGAGVRDLAKEFGTKMFFDEERFFEFYSAWHRGGYLDRILPGSRKSDVEDPLSVFATRPSRVDSTQPLRARQFVELPAALAIAPARLEFRIPAPARPDEIRHATLAIAFDPCGYDPRLQVVVSSLAANGTASVLLERELAPRERPEDAGWQTLDIAIDSPYADVLVLEFEPRGTSRSPRYVLLNGVSFGAAH